MLSTVVVAVLLLVASAWANLGYPTIKNRPCLPELSFDSVKIKSGPLIGFRGGEFDLITFKDLTTNGMDNRIDALRAFVGGDVKVNTLTVAAPVTGSKVQEQDLVAMGYHRGRKTPYVYKFRQQDFSVTSGGDGFCWESGSVDRGIFSKLYQQPTPCLLETIRDEIKMECPIHETTCLEAGWLQLKLYYNRFANDIKACRNNGAIFVDPITQFIDLVGPPNYPDRVVFRIPASEFNEGLFYRLKNIHPEQEIIINLLAPTSFVDPILFNKDTLPHPMGKITYVISGEGSSIEVSTDTRGSIIAPNRDLTISSMATIIGQVVVDDIIINGGIIQEVNCVVPCQTDICDGYCCPKGTSCWGGGCCPIAQQCRDFYGNEVCCGSKPLVAMPDEGMSDYPFVYGAGEAFDDPLLIPHANSSFNAVGNRCVPRYDPVLFPDQDSKDPKGLGEEGEEGYEKGEEGTQHKGAEFGHYYQAEEGKESGSEEGSEEGSKGGLRRPKKGKPNKSYAHQWKDDGHGPHYELCCAAPFTISCQGYCCESCSGGVCRPAHWYVGTCSAGGKANSDNTFPDLQAAIDAPQVHDGDFIHVCPGLYSGNVNVYKHKLTIEAWHSNKYFELGKPSIAEDLLLVNHPKSQERAKLLAALPAKGPQNIEFPYATFEMSGNTFKVSGDYTTLQHLNFVVRDDSTSTSSTEMIYVTGNAATIENCRFTFGSDDSTPSTEGFAAIRVGDIAPGRVELLMNDRDLEKTSVLAQLNKLEAQDVAGEFNKFSHVASHQSNRFHYSDAWYREGENCPRYYFDKSECRVNKLTIRHNEFKAAADSLPDRFVSAIAAGYVQGVFHLLNNVFSGYHTALFVNHTEYLEARFNYVKNQQVGIIVKNAKQAAIDDNTFINIAYGPAVMSRKVRRVSVENNHVYVAAAGIFVDSFAYAAVCENFLYSIGHNYAEAFVNAIELDQSMYPCWYGKTVAFVAKNYIASSKVEWGIAVHATHTVVMISNTHFETSPESYCIPETYSGGLLITRANSLELVDSYVANTFGCGIAIYDVDQIKAEYNHVHHVETGVLVHSFVNASISNNVVYETLKYGIIVEESKDTHVGKISYNKVSKTMIASLCYIGLCGISDIHYNTFKENCLDADRDWYSGYENDREEIPVAGVQYLKKLDITTENCTTELALLKHYAGYKSQINFKRNFVNKIFSNGVTYESRNGELLNNAIISILRNGIDIIGTSNEIAYNAFSNVWGTNIDASGSNNIHDNINL